MRFLLSSPAFAACMRTNIQSFNYAPCPGDPQFTQNGATIDQIMDGLLRATRNPNDVVVACIDDTQLCADHHLPPGCSAGSANGHAYPNNPGPEVFSFTIADLMG